MTQVTITIQDIRKDFPFFDANPELAYLDTAASSQKAKVVLTAMDHFLEQGYSNVHRGLYPISEKATANYEASREKVARLINALPEEIVFTSGTTASINLAARMIAQNLKPGDEIVTSIMEHHSNFVPWQQLAEQYHLSLKIIPLTTTQQLDMDAAKKLITDKTKVVAITHISNVLGCINPIEEIVRLAHNKGALAVIDGAQAIAHTPVDVKKLGVDFYAFSGHKMYGPTGIGVLYGKKKLLERFEPQSWGGEMIESVTVEKTIFADVPTKFEPGTPNITGAIGLGTAADYLRNIGYAVIQQHEHEIVAYTFDKLKTIKGLAIIGPQDPKEHSGAIAFDIDGIHAHDLAHILGMNGVAVRAGNHCAQPLHNDLGIASTTRASIGIYTTTEEIDKLIVAIEKARSIFA